MAAKSSSFQSLPVVSGLNIGTGNIGSRWRAYYMTRRQEWQAAIINNMSIMSHENLRDLGRINIRSRHLSIWKILVISMTTHVPSHPLSETPKTNVIHYRKPGLEVGSLLLSVIKNANLKTAILPSAKRYIPGIKREREGEVTQCATVMREAKGFWEYSI